MASLVPSFGSLEIRILRRSVAYWFLMRIVGGVFSVALGGNPWVLAPRASLILITVVFILVFIVVRRNHEDLFLRNMGTSPGLLNTLCFGPALAMELIAGLVW